MTSEQPSPSPDGEQASDVAKTQPDATEAAREIAEAQPEDAEAQPDVRERWWWTGAFRAVLGGAVVGYQVPVMSSGDATGWNWLIAAVGAGVAVWGIWIVWTAYRAQRTAD